MTASSTGESSDSNTPIFSIVMFWCSFVGSLVRWFVGLLAIIRSETLDVQPKGGQTLACSKQSETKLTCIGVPASLACHQAGKPASE